MADKIGYRGNIFYFKDTATLATLPQITDSPEDADCQYVYIEDALLVVEEGKIVAVGSYSDLIKQYANIHVVDYQEKLITPGFIDTHQHATQGAIVEADGDKIINWLTNFAFPSEGLYQDVTTARNKSSFFLDQLIRNGTTTAVSYGPSFYEATDVYFDEIQKRNMRFVMGNVLMDENAPDALKMSAQESYDVSKKLITKWHDTHRMSYCISPRFALGCSEKLLELCGSLKKEHSTCYIQTHLDQTQDEVEEVKRLYPWSKHYLGVYDRFGLVTDKSVFGHCIYTTQDELALLKSSGAIISWCPLSDNFLGSGLFNLPESLKYTDKITLATDWGSGNSLSMFSVLDEAYKVSLKNNYKLPSMTRWYMATLGSAKALQLDKYIGNFGIGKEADFIVVAPDATPFFQYRHHKSSNIFDQIFVLMTLGSEVNIMATYIYGKAAYLDKSLIPT